MWAHECTVYCIVRDSNINKDKFYIIIFIFFNIILLILIFVLTNIFHFRLLFKISKTKQNF